MAATPKRAARRRAGADRPALDRSDASRAAMAALDADFTPLTDMRASAAYRRTVGAQPAAAFFLETQRSRRRRSTRGWRCRHERDRRLRPPAQRRRSAASPHDSAAQACQRRGASISTTCRSRATCCMPRSACRTHRACAHHAAGPGAGARRARRRRGADGRATFPATTMSARRSPAIRSSPTGWSSMPASRCSRSRPTSIDAARAAAARAVVEYEVLPPILTIDEALAAAELRAADADDAARRRRRRRWRRRRIGCRGRIEIGGQDHFYLEGQVAMAIPGEDGDMLVLQLDPASDRGAAHRRALRWACPTTPWSCEMRRMGGGFGGKETPGRR